MRKYYKKEMLSTALILPSGHRVRFTQLGQSDTGLLETEDENLQKELDVAVKRHVGGVVELTFQQADDLKKKPPVSRPRQQYALHLSTLSRPRPPSVQGDAAAAGKAAPPPEPTKRESEPLSVPDKLPVVTTLRRARGRRGSNAAPAAPAIPAMP